MYLLHSEKIVRWFFFSFAFQQQHYMTYIFFRTEAVHWTGIIIQFREVGVIRRHFLLLLIEGGGGGDENKNGDPEKNLHFKEVISLFFPLSLSLSL